tara:strand:- start:327 stop:590 length:264 start_codon:yes stop_codon:yes gene_type:complete
LTKIPATYKVCIVNNKGVGKMNLEEEALNYSKGKEAVFVENLTGMCEDLEKLVISSLDPCYERKMVEQRIREVYLWAKYCSELHGVK